MPGVQVPSTSDLQRARATQAETDHAPIGVRALRRWPLLIAVNTASIIVLLLAGEVGCRWFWNARYWLQSEQLGRRRRANRSRPQMVAERVVFDGKRRVPRAFSDGWAGLPGATDASAARFRVSDRFRGRLDH